MAALLRHPAECLDLLLDPAVVYGIASWERLDSDVVREFTLAGLYDAVAADPGRLGDGYRVIATLTTIANGPLDDGLNPAHGRRHRRIDGRLHPDAGACTRLRGQRRDRS